MPDRAHAIRELRDKAKRYRSLAREVPDETTAERILALTEELEQQARDIEQGE